MEKTYDPKREGFAIEKMNYTFYGIICNSADVFSLWNYETLKNSVRARQTTCVCVCMCKGEKEVE